MMQRKRGRPSFRRTTSMTGFTVDSRNDVVEESCPPAAMIKDPSEHRGPSEYTAMVSPRYYAGGGGWRGSGDIETADFLRSCGLCNRRLAAGRDIYMYRGDSAFCSQECREQQMKHDERKDKCKLKLGNNGENHHNLSELSDAAATPGKSETVAAA